MINLVDVLAKYPNLTMEGLETDTKHPGFALARAQLPEALDELVRALAWLRAAPKAKTPRHSSYILKHAAERWAHGYVSNGALITAALMLEIPICEEYRGRPTLNPFIGIGVRSKWPRQPEHPNRWNQ
jgi:hypothetical protein